jgi:hypothetical protein
MQVFHTCINLKFTGKEKEDRFFDIVTVVTPSQYQKNGIKESVPRRVSPGDTDGLFCAGQV